MGRASWEWPAAPPEAYRGQLDGAFQRHLAAQWADVEREDCFFYHSAEMPDGEVIPGAWDLRGTEERYLGHVDVAGHRVLELGPATGHLTWWMESRGADVVGFDAGFDVTIDLLPVPGRDLDADRREAMRGEGIAAVQNSWWYLHRELKSEAKMAYGDIYAMPDDLGRFDVAVFGAILLHLHDPFSALAEAAAMTEGTMVVVDLIQGGLGQEHDALMRFDPLAAPEHRTNWWALSPGAVIAMLRRLGFGNTRVERHTQRHHLGHRLDEPPTGMEMFTVVGERSAGAASR